MKKELVQISKREFDDIQKMALLNQEEIEKEAKKLYEKKGAFSYEFFIYDKGGCPHEFRFKSNSFDSYKSKKEIVKEVKWRFENYFYSNYGDYFELTKELNQKIKGVENLRLKTLTMTVLGWLLATTLVIIHLLK